MAHLTFRVSDQLAAKFETAAARRGGKSRLLRTLVESVTHTGGSDALTPTIPQPASDKVTIRLRREELDRLDAAALQAGMRRTEWAVACLRRRLLNEPQFDRARADALLGARRELRRISDQVREVVREVRGGDLPVSALEPKLEALDALQQEVRAQLEEVRRALKGEATYWGELDG